MQDVNLLLDQVMPLIDIHLQQYISEVDMEVQVALVPTRVVEVKHCISILH